MKSHFQKIGSILMAFLLLLSTLSFRVDMHFCGNHLVDLSFTSKAATCGMEFSDEDLGSCIMAAMNCCKDVEVFIHGQDDLQISSDTFVLNITYQPAVPAAQFQLILPNQIPVLRVQSFRDYSPPPLIRQVHLINQTFLI